MTRRKLLAVAAVTLLSAVALVALWLTSRDTEPSTAVERQTDECLPEAMVPAFAPALDESDCVVSVAVADKERQIIGTKNGLIGLIESGRLAKASEPPLASGAVTGISIQEGLVSFVVDQGVGVLSTSDETFVELPAGGKLVSSGYYVEMPGKGRPEATARGYTQMSTDGVEQLLSLGPTDYGELCASYLAYPGAWPDRLWCTPAGTLFPPPPFVTPAPRPPKVCTDTLPAASVDSAHTLTVTVGAGGFSTTRLEVKAGHLYELAITNAEPGFAHLWKLDGAKLSNGQDLCGVLLDSGQKTIFLNIPVKGTYRFYDELHPGLGGELVVN
ncbi:MAG TPA: hypothetical protein VFP63_08425 [Dehalococcoidia bacterium]|nr:hypothetical protein [Dehalococcoidia bacterium]